MITAPRLYLSRAGKDGEDEPAALEQGLAIIGFLNRLNLETAHVEKMGSVA